MTITLEQTAEIHHTMDRRVYRIWLQKVTAHLNGQKMTRLLLNHHELALMNDTVTTLIGSKEEICELVVAEPWSGHDELPGHLCYPWTILSMAADKLDLMAQASTFTTGCCCELQPAATQRASKAHLLCYRVWRSCSQPAASEGSTIRHLIQLLSVTKQKPCLKVTRKNRVSSTTHPATPKFLPLLLYQDCYKVKEKGWDEVRSISAFWQQASKQKQPNKQMKAKLPAASQLHSNLSKLDTVAIKAKSNLWVQTQNTYKK